MEQATPGRWQREPLRGTPGTVSASRALRAQLASQGPGCSRNPGGSSRTSWEQGLRSCGRAGGRQALRSSGLAHTAAQGREWGLETFL